MKIQTRSVAFSFIFLLSINLVSQENVVADKIVAVVGGSVVLQSDVENQYMQMAAQRQRMDKCEIFERFLEQKLMVNQAKVDSIEVNDGQVEMQLENRMDFFIQQAGSKEKLEEYFKRNVFQIKEDMRQPVKEQLIMQKISGEITGNIKITPTEVTEFYESLNQDSIPMVNSQIEYLQILKYPPYTEQSIYEVKQKLLGLRKRVIDGEKFATLALLYSEDPGSARNGGEIGLMSKGELDPEYAKVAWNLKDGAVSNIVESQFGYHIIQRISKLDDRVNTRHILIKPKATDKEIKEALLKMDSIVTLLKKDTIKFEQAALFFSDDKSSRLSGGKVVNPQTNSTKFELDQLSQEDYYTIKKMQVGEMSEPYLSKDENHKDAYKLVKLISRSTPHKANLKDDYQLLMEYAIEAKKKKVLDKWIDDKISTTYLRIEGSYKACKLSNSKWISLSK